jgi:starch phosphorylase
MESQSFYDLLEKEIVPMFYDRGADGLPRRWINTMKNSMKTCCPFFNTNRMVQQYTENFYLPAAHRWSRFSQEEYTVTKEVAAWRKKVQTRWDEVQIEAVDAKIPEQTTVGNELPVTAQIRLGSIKPDEVSVELYFGPLDARGLITTGNAATLICEGQNGSPETYRYRGAIPCEYSGQYGYALRIVPNHPELQARYHVGLVRWG